MLPPRLRRDEQSHAPCRDGQARAPTSHPPVRLQAVYSVFCEGYEPEIPKNMDFLQRGREEPVIDITEDDDDDGDGDEAAEAAGVAAADGAAALVAPAVAAAADVAAADVAAAVDATADVASASGFSTTSFVARLTAERFKDFDEFACAARGWIVDMGITQPPVFNTNDYRVIRKARREVCARTAAPWEALELEAVASGREADVAAMARGALPTWAPGEQSVVEARRPAYTAHMQPWWGVVRDALARKVLTPMVAIATGYEAAVEEWYDSAPAKGASAEEIAAHKLKYPRDPALDPLRTSRENERPLRLNLSVLTTAPVEEASLPFWPPASSDDNFRYGATRRAPVREGIAAVWPTAASWPWDSKAKQGAVRTVRIFLNRLSLLPLHAAAAFFAYFATYYDHVVSMLLRDRNCTGAPALSICSIARATYTRVCISSSARAGQSAKAVWSA